MERVQNAWHPFLVGTATSGLMVRRITFHDVVAERQFEFLTNVLESAVPPGVLAQLYRMRWGIEKSFDEVKNKLGKICQAFS